jgi:methionine synthase II (cobalamin-independent)
MDEEWEVRLKGILDQLTKAQERWKKREITNEEYAELMVDVASDEITNAERKAIDLEAEAKHQRLFADELKRVLAILHVKV